MEPKKNPKADLNRNSSLYFVIGLALMLGVTYMAIEWKKYDADNSFDYALDVDDDLDEDIPITEQIKTPPPPPPHLHQKLLKL